MHRKSYYGLLDTGHNCYYRMMRRATMDWRRLLLGMAIRFLAILRKEHAEVSSDNASYIFHVRVKATYLQGFAGCYICKCLVFLGVGNFSNPFTIHIIDNEIQFPIMVGKIEDHNVIMLYFP